METLRQWTDAETEAIMETDCEFDGNEPPAHVPQELREWWQKLSCCEPALTASAFRTLSELQEGILQTVVERRHMALLARQSLMFEMLRARLQAGSIEHKLAMILEDLACDVRTLQVHTAIEASRKLTDTLGGDPVKIAEDLLADLDG